MTTIKEILYYVFDVILTLQIQQHAFMPEIAHRESRNNWKAVNYNFDKTYDLGKYQINDMTRLEMERTYNMSPSTHDAFLNDSTMQKRYVVALLHYNSNLLNQHQIPLCHLKDTWPGVYGFITTWQIKNRSNTPLLN